MKIYTAHQRGQRLVLVPEGGSLPALIFGPFWLAAHGAWLSAMGVVIVNLLLGRAATLHLVPPWPAACAIAVAFAVGMFGQDLRRAELAAGGFRPLGVIAGRGNDEARLRLADQGRLPIPGRV